MLRGDWEYLWQTLDAEPSRDRKAQIRAEYKARFLRAHDDEPNPVKKANAGRWKANFFLTQLREKYWPKLKRPSVERREFYDRKRVDVYARR